MTDLTCDLFVDADYSFDDLCVWVAAAVEGTTERWTVTAPPLILDIEHNEYRRTGARDEFLRFPYVIAIQPIEMVELSLEEYLDRVGLLMEALAAGGMRVVAACDWEDQLPGGGRLEPDPNQERP